MRENFHFVVQLQPDYTILQSGQRVRQLPRQIPGTHFTNGTQSLHAKFIQLCLYESVKLIYVDPQLQPGTV